MANKRVYVEVSGGVVQSIDVPVETDGTSCIIDWDNIEADPQEAWAAFDAIERDYIIETHPDEYSRYFSGDYND
jgi:hypothetical protein